MTHQYKNRIFAIFICFCVILLLIVVIMDIKSTNASRAFLEESIKSQLISISVAARQTIDVEEFISYNTPADIEGNENYQDTLMKLRSLANSVDAKYIYALKEIDGKYYFIFDTDPKTDTSFTTYDLSPVHLRAFSGQESADIMNVQDEFGSFNTGAVPLLHKGKVVGIVSADIEDAFTAKNIGAARLNAIILFLLLALTLAIMGVMVFMLLTRVKNMQDKLRHMAHYDKLTELPNRQYLFDHLSKITSIKKKEPFALLFIDLDNFKSVNDHAGHDAGDQLLKRVGIFLENAHRNSKVFRPGAGVLNVAARIGGDEFILTVPDINDHEDAEEFCRELLSSFNSDTVDKYVDKYKVGLSIGVSLYPYHSENYHVLINYADIAMYAAKRAGKSTYKVYSDDLRALGHTDSSTSLT